MKLHPITQKSFTIIDQEIGDHSFSSDEYAVVRRVIHSTADFEFAQLIQFSESAIAHTINALRQGLPIVTDVGMVALGIRSMIQQTFQNPVISAVSQVKTALPGCTLTETGILQCWEHYPEAIYAIGNAPTALLALCRQIQARYLLEEQPANPSLSKRYPVVIGAPVGFVSVLESKQLLAQTPVEQIRVSGRKGGSAVAAGIVNALLYLAWQQQEGLKEEK